MNDRSAFVRIDKADGIATIWLDVQNEKMNIISPALIDVFNDVLEGIGQDSTIEAVVLISGKRDFVAGADIKAFKADKREDFLPIVQKGHAIMNRIESSTKPIVAAISGTCFGLGTEMSLACRARICTDEAHTKIALPEVKLGLLPGAGGTQRLPRLIGLSKSLDILLTGKNVFAKQALQMGLVDEVVHINKLHAAAIQLAKKIVRHEFKRHIRKSLLQRFLDHTYLGRFIVFKQAKKTVLSQTQGNYPAPLDILQVVRYGLANGLTKGLEMEGKKFVDLMLGDVSKALIQLFFSMSDNKKNPYGVPSKPIKELGIIGAGFMGAGIAEVTMGASIPLRMFDVNEAMLSSAKKTIWGNIQKKIDKRIIGKTEAEKTFMLVQSVGDITQLIQAEIIIEAVVEKMEVKKSIIKNIEALGNTSQIFASNTSSLSVTEMAEASTHKDKIIGMHYFSPVPKMPLLEIVKTAYTSDATLSLAYDLGVKQGKTCIVVKDGPGFYVNRILSPYLNECLLMMEEGISIERIDHALTSKGFPVGPLKLMDEVGIDIVVHATNANKEYASKRKGYMPNHGLDKMFAAGFLGKKSKKGFYLYDSKTGKATGTNPEIKSFFSSNSPRENTDEVICQRAIYLMLKEAKACLEEGIISNEQDGNLGAIFGIGFLPYTGGPFNMIHTIGQAKFTETLQKLAADYGARFDPT